MNIREKFQKLRDELNHLSTIQVNSCIVTFYAPKRFREKARQIDTPGKIISFYEKSDGFELDWELLNSSDSNTLGKVKILSLEKAIQDWNNVVYFEDSNPSDPIRKFHPFDFFVDELCTGFFLGEKEDTSLYLYDFTSDLFRLDIDVFGYIELLIMAKGFLYWQYALKTLKTGVDNPQTEKFRDVAPQIFPSFDFSEFAQSYKHLRLSRL